MHCCVSIEWMNEWTCEQVDRERFVRFSRVLIWHVNHSVYMYSGIVDVCNHAGVSPQFCSQPFFSFFLVPGRGQRSATVFWNVSHSPYETSTLKWFGYVEHVNCNCAIYLQWQELKVCAAQHAPLACFRKTYVPSPVYVRRISHTVRWAQPQLIIGYLCKQGWFFFVLCILRACGESKYWRWCVKITCYKTCAYASLPPLSHSCGKNSRTWK